MTDVLVWLVSLPLIGALFTLMLPRSAMLIVTSTAVATVLAAGGLVYTLATQGNLQYELGGWTAGLGIVLRADGLSALLIAMMALIITTTSIYASGYFHKDSDRAHFWPLWLLMWTSLNALLLSGDLFNLYVALELLGLSAVSLASLGGKKTAVEASLRYLLVGLLGSMIFLAGISLIYAGYGSLDLAALSQTVEAGPVAWTALIFMTSGLLFKAALFPLHFWLPPAHGNAPAPVSAVLSALVVKAAFYLVLRLWLGVFDNVITPAAANVLGALGAGAVLWGSWQALRAERLKLLAAYSTVAQLGYLFLFFPILWSLAPGPTQDMALGGLVMLALTHGFAKTSLFLAIGNIQQRAGHDNIRDLDGTAQSLPATIFTIGLAGVALIGLPPSGAFLGKWQLLAGAMATGQWLWVAVVIAGSLLAAAYMFRVLCHAFGNRPYPGVPVQMTREEWPAMILALIAALILGLSGAGIWTLMERGV